MAKFCIHCGKPLEEGEVCSCQQDTVENETPQQTADTENSTSSPINDTTDNASNATKSNEFMEKLKLIFTKFTDYFKSPTNTVKDFAAKNDSIYGILMICINLIVVFLLMLILINSATNVLNSIPFISFFGGLLSDSAFSIALMITVLFAAYYFAMAGMLTLTTKTMFKGNITFRESVSIVGVNAFINAFVLIGSVIIMQISPTLGAIVLYLGFLYSSLIEYVSYIEMADIPSDKKVYALLISLVCVILAVFIARAVMSSIIGPSYSSSLDGSFGSDYFDFY